MWQTMKCCRRRREACKLVRWASRRRCLARDKDMSKVVTGLQSNPVTAHEINNMIGFCTNVVLNLTSKRGKHSVFNGLKVQFHNPEVGGSRKGTRRFAPSQVPLPQPNQYILLFHHGKILKADFTFRRRLQNMLNS